MSDWKGKEDGIYIVPLSMHIYSQSAQAWITHFYVERRPWLPFLCRRLWDGGTI